MKRFLTILLASLAVAGLLCVGVSASSFDGAAAELASIGVLKGSAEGFQLDQVPTRAQAAIMLVRLFGAEDEAKAAYAAGELECPFTDVGEAAAPSVAWLAAKGLAGGTSADTFGASSPCTAKAYTIFLLRAWAIGTMRISPPPAPGVRHEHRPAGHLPAHRGVPPGRFGVHDLSGPGHGLEGWQRLRSWRA